MRELHCAREFADSWSRWGRKPTLVDEHQQRVSRFLAEQGPRVLSYPTRQWLVENYLPSTRGPLLTVGVGPVNSGEWELLPEPRSYQSVDIDPASCQFSLRGHHRLMDAFSLREQGAYSHVVAFGMLGERNGRSAYEHHVGDDRSHELISTLAACVGHGGELLLGPELLGKSIQKSAKEARTRMRALRGHPTLAGEFTLLYAIHDRCNLVTVFRRHNN